MALVYKICIPHTMRDSFDYLTNHIQPTIGARVSVPFRKQTRLGIVIGVGAPEKKDLDLKYIEKVIDEVSILSDEIIKLCMWISSYYQSPLSEVFPLACTKKFRLGKVCQLPLKEMYQLALPLQEAKEIIKSHAKKQIELIEFLHSHSKPISKKSLAQKGFQSRQLSPLLNANILNLVKEPLLPEGNLKALKPALILNSEQILALSAICTHLTHYHCFLLQGVTGSGKTEVYLQVIAKILAQEKQVLILVPEIGLTPQLLSRFKERFSEPIGVIHSHLCDNERQTTCLLAQKNQIKLIIGTRSAVFTPFSQLGLIVIDEEHDSSLKQCEGVRYSARDTALMRAFWTDIPIILGSATPSLESLYNSQNNKYTLLRLTHKALTTINLEYQLIDLRCQILKQGLCAQTLKIIEEHLEKNNQVLVFINRRGYAPILLCHRCGWIADCSACDSHLILHKTLGQMQCHHCGYRTKLPVFCPRCQHKELIPIGAGTQRVHEYLKEHFPTTDILRVDSDEVRKKNSLEHCLDKISRGETKLIIGTQMLAKGHHFPQLSLVVVADGDAGLYNQDFKAMEHLGQLLIQVSGRAGRAEYPGKVLIQTHLPNHPLLNLLIQHGYDKFSAALLSLRQQAQLPPYYFLAVVRAQGKSMQLLEQFLQEVKAQLLVHPLKVLGPAPAPIARKANQYRLQLMVKSSSRKKLGQALIEMRKALQFHKLTQGIRWSVDVDPVDLS